MPPDERLARLEVRVDHLHDSLLRVAGQIEAIDLKMDRLIVHAARIETVEEKCKVAHSQSSELQIKVTKLETWLKVALGMAAVGSGAGSALSYILK